MTDEELIRLNRVIRDALWLGYAVGLKDREWQVERKKFLADGMKDYAELKGDILFNGSTLEPSFIKKKEKDE